MSVSCKSENQAVPLSEGNISFKNPLFSGVSIRRIRFFKSKWSKRQSLARKVRQSKITNIKWLAYGKESIEKKVFHIL